MSGLIGVLGGVFDPVHNGHLAVAVLAREFFNLEKIVFIPSGNPPHKQCTSSIHRLAMLKLALCNEPGALVWEGEINRPGISYTIETLDELQKWFSQKIYFVIGSDNLTEIADWKDFREILRLVTLCISHRPGYAFKIPAAISSYVSYLKFPSPEWGISSTMIRSYLEKGFSCRHLLPDVVIDYIVNKGLYRK